MDELRCDVYDIIEERYIQGVVGGIDAGHEILQIFVDPLNRKAVRMGEQSMSREADADFPGQGKIGRIGIQA